jgi:hypothetical protein
MTKEKKAEIIKTLVECKHSGFTEGDQAMLEQAPDARLESFLVAAEARKKEVTEAKVEHKTLTEEEFMKVAPESLKSLISRQQQQDTELKAGLVSALKSAQAEYTESELAAMSIANLERLARVVKIEEEKPNYEGRGVVRAAEVKSDVLSNPPEIGRASCRERV